MKFTIKKQALYKSLASVGRAASTHSPLPILSGILFNLKNDSLELVASDSNISIREIIERTDDNQLTVYEEGRVVLEARYILEAVRKLDASIINIEIIDGALTRVSGNQAEYNINGSKADLYPAIDFAKPDTTFTLKGTVFSEVISQTAFVCSTSEDRPIFTGVNFKTDGTTLNCIATDSYRLAKKTIEIPEGLNFNICIPATNLYEVQKTIQTDSEVEIAVSDRLVQFYVDNTLIQSRLIDGLFPDVNRLIPNEYGFEMLMNKSEMINALDRSSFLKADGSWTVKLESSPESVILSSRSQEIGSSEEVLQPLEYIGGILKISFSGRYLIEALKSFKTESIRILFVGEMQAFVLRSPGDDSIIQLILPLRTFD
ncbi:DNA polymerase III subunit beta [Erysipelothrix sp. HDW6A]|uniref:DNA polymerase III subunit beta n=1 Tax=Erysipelothrix sp. HDW6A TaxID=2714928 RepID=UPI001407E408|nr:DNA polymerase III subunit beta [Erysipelothrix sp. HDW6A]QIK56586.1 DNA polymerase III subunit beta [Erysipelothrix sp. HDW6A]